METDKENRFGFANAVIACIAIEAGIAGWGMFVLEIVWILTGK